VTPSARPYVPISVRAAAGAVSAAVSSRARAGRWVAFASCSDGLTDEDDDGSGDLQVYVKDPG
jgi:hypothetical protein